MTVRTPEVSFEIGEQQKDLKSRSSARKAAASFPFCLLLSAVISVIPFFCMKVYYMYGDDYLMNYIANGSYGEEFSDHLIFPRILFGTLTKFLYGITKEVNWYAVLLAATVIVSFAVYHYLLQKFSENPVAFAVSLILNASVIPYFFTFTVAGFLAVGAGSALLFASFFESRPVKYMIPGALLMLWGYVVRNDTLIPGMIMAFPLAVYALAVFMREKEKRRMFLRNICLLFLTAVLSVGCLYGMRIWEQKAYRGDGWSAYRTWNRARSTVLDYPGVGYDVLEEGFKEIDFSRQEYSLLYRWSFGEKKVFSERKLLEIGMVQSNIYSDAWRKAFTKVTLSTKPNYYVLIIPFFIFALFLFIDRKYRIIIALGECLLLTAVILALCLIRMRFLLRVSVPLSMLAISGILLMTRSRLRETVSAENPALRAVRIAGGAALTVMLLLSVSHFITGYNQSVITLRDPKINVSSQAALEEVRSHPDRVYLAESYAFARMYYYGHPISEITTIDDYSHVIRSGSWDSFTPRYYRILENLKFSDPDNLISSLLTEEGYYMLTDKPEPTLSYLNSISDRKVKADVEDIGDGVLKLVRYHF